MWKQEGANRIHIMSAMATVKLTIDGQSIECSAGRTIIEAADAAGIYIPRICHHPDLSPVSEVTRADVVYQAETRIVGENRGANIGKEAHCNLCLVEIEGQPELVNSCITLVDDELIVQTDTKEVIRRRKEALSKLLADHPHACLTCDQREGCSRTDCSANVPVEERCCVLLGRCELGKVSEYIGIPNDTHRYIPQQLTSTENDPLFTRDYNLCIGCLRCIRVCRKVQGLDVLGAIWKNNRAWVGTLTGAGLKEAQCRFCGACVEVCPTGALLDKEGVPAVRRDSPLPCVANCPAGIDIPGYVRSIAAGRNRVALDIIRSRVPFPGILGYVCFHPCEDVCRRSEIDQPVAICDLKRYVADAVVNADSRPINRKSDTGKKVAIIGSGPTGLTAAYYLGSLGNQVSLFDQEHRPGGMLRYGIPDYRLPPEILDGELGVLDTLGISLHMDHRFDSENRISELKSQGFDALLVTIGASVSKALPIENSDLDGVYLGLEFLKSAKLSQELLLGDQVVVIGGGNVAVDAAMTAIRLGARFVHLVCLESRDEMPAYSWEIAQAEEEGVEIHPSWGPRKFTSSRGRISGIELKRCTRVFDEQGDFDPQYDESEIKHISAQSVIVTIGQQVDLEPLNHVKNLSRGPGAALNVDKDFSFGLEGVFAAGDMIRGPSSVVEAIADGRRVADIIDRYIGGNGLADSDQTSAEIDIPTADVSRDQFLQHRQQCRSADPEERKSGFGLIQQTLSEQEAMLEAQRCLQCHLRRQITPVVLPPERWLPLNEEAMDSVPDVEGVFQLLNDEKRIIRITGTPNMRQDLRSWLENPGNAKWFLWEEDPMYTKRESELIQQYLQEHGELPGGGGSDDDLDDLF
ncbi:MAG: FAD-dependent oxidoreductase [candidate division Zixibacteria bacterium]|nr:FAD-dependent oxidoreductase [candidate division Zixibacteria bacterium]